MNYCAMFLEAITMRFCMLIWIFLSELRIAAPDMKVSGHVGGSVRIPCSHSFANTNTKYFCKNPCETERHILIKSGPSSTGKYRLMDEGDGRFYVTITDLQISDTGTYWCGVDRSVKDTFEKVVLTVTEAPHPAPPKTPSAAPARTVRSTEPSTFSPSTISHSTPISTFPAQLSLSTSPAPTDRFQGVKATLLYSVAVLVGMLTMIGLSLIALYKCRITTSKFQCTVSAGSEEINNTQTEAIRAPPSTVETQEETLENPLYSPLELGLN